MNTVLKLLLQESGLYMKINEFFKNSVFLLFIFSSPLNFFFEIFLPYNYLWEFLGGNVQIYM